MFYNYFTGQGVSAQTLANNVVDILAKSVPGLQTGRLARSLAVKLKAIVNTTNGFQWSDLASIITDLASFILSVTPAAPYSAVVNALWSL
ncbi:hypothetical protein BUZ85_20330, partial [Mammaliicoccus sciuri]